MSKKVFLRRKEVMNHLPKEVRAEAVVKLSSVYVNRQPLKAFSKSDEAKYLDGILDVGAGHNDWPKHTKEYWANLTIPVGFTGVELEIGVNEDGDPINIIDYIKYNFALKHPHVAMTKAELDTDNSKRFYIHDDMRADMEKNKTVKTRKDADKEFIKISSSVKNMKRVLRLMSDMSPDRLTDEQIENALYEIKDKNPKKFIRIALDKNLEMKSEVEEMVSAGVLRRIGNQVIFIDEVIGDTVDDAIVHLKDKKNSGKLTIMRAKLKELAL